MNYFEFYSGDYTRDTADLTLIEHGAFLLLLADYYATEIPKPNHNPTLFRIARAMTKEEQDAVIRVADRFFPVSASDGLRHNARADTEIAKARARIESARENGKRGGRPPKPRNNPTLSNPVNPNGTQPLTQTLTQKKAPQTPCSKEEQELKSPPAASVDVKADLFARWKALPGSGGGAFLVKLLRDHKPEQRVFDALETTMAETRADPKSYVIGVLARNDGPTDPADAAAANAERVCRQWDTDPDSAPWAGAL